MLTSLALVLLLGGSALSIPPPRKEIAKPRDDDVNYRLPGDIVPLKYEILLQPYFGNKTFKGEVTIDIQVKEATDAIILHQLNLTMPTEDGFKVIHTSETIKVESADTDGTPEQQFYKIALDKNLTKDETYKLEIGEFWGTLNEGNRGFYYAEYRDADGTLRPFATTQFEPTKAREAFPCFDEPAMKAKFQITIRRPTSYNSVSNMPLKETNSVNADEKEDVYEETVDMSTYLIAFIVSEMELAEEGTQRVLAKPVDIDAGKAKFALDTGKLVLDGIANWLNVNYSLPKMDQAAIPDRYFSAGAMENWGLVTYRETYLLYSPETTIITRQQSIATIIAHEFGHQWFGNLVSPEWWQYIWLNEGFATYFEFLGAALAYPSWNLMDQFVVRNTQNTFGPDSLESTRIMNMYAGSPDAISDLFDSIAYGKSGSVIRMMEMFLTTEVYKQGLKNYLEDRQYKAANPDHLYESMQKALDEINPALLPDGLNVSQILKSWDSAEGYPVVTVQRNYGSVDNNVVVNQSRFLREKSTSENTNNWIIPVNFVTTSKNDFSDTTATEWLESKEDTVTVSDLTDSDWLIVNKKQTGYYRVNYDERNWNLLIEALNRNPTQIHLLNRAQLIDDAFNLARSQRLPYSVPLQLSLYLSKETDYIPFYSFFTAMNHLYGMVSGTTGQSNLRTHILNSLTTVYTHLGFDEKSTDSHVDKLNRITVLSWLCNLGHAECRTKSLEKFKAWKETGTEFAVNLQAPIFCGAMRQADKTEWDYLESKYIETSATSDSEKASRMFNALGCSEDATILKTYLGKAVDDDSISATSAFASVYNAGTTGFQTAFDYVIDNFSTLDEKLSESQLRSILSGIGNKITTKEQQDKLEALSENKDESIFASAIASAAKNVAWNDVNLVSINSWLTRDENTDDGSISNMYFSTTLIVLGYIICMQF